MKKKYRNSGSTRYNINYKNVDKSFIKDQVLFGKNHIRQKLNGFRFFIKLFTCILLIWTWKNSQNVSNRNIFTFKHIYMLDCCYLST